MDPVSYQKNFVEWCARPINNIKVCSLEVMYISDVVSVFSLLPYIFHLHVLIMLQNVNHEDFNMKCVFFVIIQYH